MLSYIDFRSTLKVSPGYASCSWPYYMAQATHFCSVCLAFSAAVSLLNLCVVKVIRYSWCLQCGFHLEAKASRTALQRSSNCWQPFHYGKSEKLFHLLICFCIAHMLLQFNCGYAKCAVRSFTVHFAYPQLNCRSIGVLV